MSSADIYIPSTDRRIKDTQVLFISGCMLLGVWLVSILLGIYSNAPLLLDLFKNPIGADFVQCYGAGALLLQGKSAQLYDQSAHIALQTSIFGAVPDGVFSFNYPPLYAVLAASFAILPYEYSFTVWTCLQLIALLFTFKLFSCESIKNSVRAIGWYPVFTSLSFGQNSLFCLFLLASVFTQVCASPS